MSKDVANVCYSFSVLIMANLSYIDFAQTKRYDVTEALVSLIRKFLNLALSPFLDVESDSVILRVNDVK